MGMLQLQLARHNLDSFECERKRGGSYERSIKHCTIAANMGLDKSLVFLKLVMGGN